jgi:hypothetical protein
MNLCAYQSQSSFALRVEIQGYIKLDNLLVETPRRGVRSRANTDVSAKRPYQTDELDAALVEIPVVLN